MAQMIPVECDLSKRPMSEQIVFKYIKEGLSDRWKVFHSFDYLTCDPNYKLWDGEIDFLLFHPEYGILVIEVKGGAISYRNGQWYQEDKVISPVEQAKKNKYAVRKLLQDRLLKAIPLKFAHAVCFPSCGNQQVWPVEAQDIVLTKDSLPHIEAFARQLLEDTPLPDSICGTIHESEIMNVLSPVFEYGTKLEERIDVEKKQFFMLTEQQCALLDAFENYRRLPVCGCAGSGKTIMAIKKAKRLASQDKKVLLLCYNQLLAKILKRTVEDFPQIKAAAFFDLCIELLKIPEDQLAPYRDNPRLYNEVLPQLLKKHIEQTCLYYDAVIVDEGQDFNQEAWSVISMLPEEDGHFYVFYDPDQNIYTSALQLPDFGVPPVILNRNCRNTKNIFNELKPYQSVASSVMESSPVGAQVRTIHGNCRRNLEAELDRLMIFEKVPPQNIVILGAHSLKNTSIGDDQRVGRYRIVSTASPLKKLEVRYFTFMKYKGCESPVVILLDVDDDDLRWKNRRGIYTAMSRAVNELIILYK